MEHPIVLFLIGMAAAAIIVLGVESQFGRRVVEMCCSLSARLETGPQHQTEPENLDRDEAETEDEVYEDRHVRV